MRYTILYPREELKDFISHFWITSKDGQGGKINTTYYSTASSLANIVFAFKGSESNPYPAFTYFQGQTSISEEIQIPDVGFFKIFGVSIYSYVIPQLFNVLVSELSNRLVPLNTLMDNQENLLTDMIASAFTTERCVNILTDYFQSQLIGKQFNDELIIKAAKQIRQHNGNINITSLSRELCISHKQFARRFKIHTGFNPKLYARIVRFESVLYSLSTYSSLTESACSSGYYDQAHFIQDFKAFTGHSPNKFFAMADL